MLNTTEVCRCRFCSKPLEAVTSRGGSLENGPVVERNPVSEYSLRRRPRGFMPEETPSDLPPVSCLRLPLRPPS
jgi:hypothetical protein